jgi:hypothetical protein
VIQRRRLPAEIVLIVVLAMAGDAAPLEPPVIGSD